jgi:hypothetical protein
MWATVQSAQPYRRPIARTSESAQVQTSNRDTGTGPRVLQNCRFLFNSQDGDAHEHH